MLEDNPNPDPVFQKKGGANQLPIWKSHPKLNLGYLQSLAYLKWVSFLIIEESLLIIGNDVNFAFVVFEDIF